MAAYRARVKLARRAEGVKAHFRQQVATMPREKLPHAASISNIRALRAYATIYANKGATDNMWGYIFSRSMPRHIRHQRTPQAKAHYEAPMHDDNLPRRVMDYYRRHLPRNSRSYFAIKPPGHFAIRPLRQDNIY